MIIPNGTLEVKAKEAGGIDKATGFPLPNSKVSWSDPIPCQWQAVTRNFIGRTESGVFTLASYTVLVESVRTRFTGEQVRLRDSSGTVIGEFSLLDTEELPAVCQTRLTLK